MSGILEALDMMYEVKGETSTGAAYNRALQTAASDHRYSSTVKNQKKQLRDGGYYPTMATGARETGGRYTANMRTAQDYRDRVNTVNKLNKLNNDADRQRAKHRAKNECTETIDTLEGILS